MVSLVHLEVRGGLTLEVTNISKYPNNFLCTILKPTEDGGSSFERPGIFYEVVSLAHLEIGGCSDARGSTL
jgi:hypothetical protein